MHALASFKRMQDSTKADWDIIVPQALELARGLPERVLAHLALLDGDHGGFPVDRYFHCRQTATLALRDGRDDEYVVCALLHDIGDTLASYNHPDVGAAILKPFVSPENHWMVEHHAVLQGYNFFHHIGLDRNLRDPLRAHPNYERTAEFVELYDNPAFDAQGPILPIEEFVPAIRRVMAAPRSSIYAAAMGGASAGPKTG